MIGIYKITNPVGEIYIGQSKNIKERISSHKQSFSSRLPNLHKSYLKYGIENHLFEVIEECSKEVLVERERYWFSELQPSLNSIIDYKSNPKPKNKIIAIHFSQEEYDQLEKLAAEDHNNISTYCKRTLRMLKLKDKHTNIKVKVMASENHDVFTINTNEMGVSCRQEWLNLSKIEKKSRIEDVILKTRKPPVWVIEEYSELQTKSNQITL